MPASPGFDRRPRAPELATDAEHARAVEVWRQERYARLRQPLSWLTLAGLSWLRPGRNRLGTDPDGDLVLPSGPRHAGVVTVANGRVTADAGAGGELRHDGTPVDGLSLVTDADPADEDGPTMLELGPLRMCVIRRGERLGLRVWDTESPALGTFEGIDHYPVNSAWRLAARWEPAQAERPISVPDVLGDVDEEPSPGSVAFEPGGVAHRLQALAGGPNGELWLIFADTTSGTETYSGGRYLYTPPPRADGIVEVDFNRAYNPPCVFSPYATCPLPWPANRLPIRIEAGERAFHA